MTTQDTVSLDKLLDMFYRERYFYKAQKSELEMIRAVQEYLDRHRGIS